MGANTNDVEKLVQDIEDNDNSLKLNNVNYKFQRFRHKERVKVFGFMTSVVPQLEAGNFEFLGTEKFEEIEKIIASNVTVSGMSLSKMPDHWEDFAANYIPFISTAMQFISYPLLKGDLTA